MVGFVCAKILQQTTITEHFLTQRATEAVRDHKINNILNTVNYKIFSLNQFRQKSIICSFV